MSNATCHRTADKLQLRLPMKRFFSFFLRSPCLLQLLFYGCLYNIFVSAQRNLVLLCSLWGECSEITIHNIFSPIMPWLWFMQRGTKMKNHQCYVAHCNWPHPNQESLVKPEAHSWSLFAWFICKLLYPRNKWSRHTTGNWIRSRKGLVTYVLWC